MTRDKRSPYALLCLLFAAPALAQSPELVPVVSKTLSRTVDLPGEIQPFLNVTVYAKIAGYIDKVLVDRGSIVKQSDTLVELTAPELQAQIAEVESKAAAVAAEVPQAEAQLAAAQATYERLKKAAETPGAVAGNEVIQAQKQVEAAQALIAAKKQAIPAAQSAIAPIRDLQAYLTIKAPFDGVVTDRLVHPGALVGKGADPLLVIQQVSRLRLIVAVPEEYVGGLVQGAAVSFQVPAHPGRNFSGTIARIPHVLDPKTRTMPVELDVANRDGALAPGMYPTAKWPVRGSQPALLVPKTAVVTTTERTFVIRDHEGKAEWVDVRKGAADGDNIAVMGNLKAGDRIVRRGSDELRDGSALPRK